MSYLEGLPETVVEDVPPKRLRVFGVWTATILGLAVLLTVAYYVPLWPVKQDELTVSFVRGEAVLVSDDGSTAELVPGAVVERGQSVRTEDGASISFAAADGHSITISDASNLEVMGSRGTLLGNERNTRFEVSKGNVRVTGEGESRTSMEIGLPNGVAGVRGTIFDVNVGDELSSVSVHQGEVDLADSGEPVKLQPGQGAVLTPGGKLVKDLPRAPEMKMTTYAVVRKTGEMFNWDPVDGGESYVVEIASDERFLDIVDRIESAETGAEIPILDIDPPLFARVYAVSSDGLTGARSEPLTLQVSPHWLEGLRLRTEGDHEGAIAEFEKGRERYPEVAQLVREIGWTRYLDQEYEEARAIYEEAHSLDPDDIALSFEMGRVYFWLEDYDRAEKTFKSILENHPDDAHALWGLGDTYRLLGRTAEARELVEKALIIQPDHPYAKETLKQLR